MWPTPREAAVLCCWGGTQEANIRGLLARGCALRTRPSWLPQSSAVDQGQRYSRLSTTRPPQAYSCPSCQLLSLQEELIVQFPSPKLSSDAKQNKTITDMLLQGTVAYWKMLTWAKNSIHSLHVIRATQFDFHCCVFHSLLRGTIIWSTGCEELGNPRWSNGLCPLSPRWALDTMWLMPVAVGQLGIWLTPNTR